MNATDFHWTGTVPSGQCRFSELAPEWDEFYEVLGELFLHQLDATWCSVIAPVQSAPGVRTTLIVVDTLRVSMPDSVKDVT